MAIEAQPRKKMGEKGYLKVDAWERWESYLGG